MLDKALHARLLLFLTENAQFEFKKEIEKINRSMEDKRQQKPCPLSTPPSSPPLRLLSGFGAKEMAKYLTLADFHLLGSIQPYDLLNPHKVKEEHDVIDMMTKRANMVTI
jgi:hypothetical protein